MCQARHQVYHMLFPMLPKTPHLRDKEMKTSVDNFGVSLRMISSSKEKRTSHVSFSPFLFSKQNSMSAYLFSMWTKYTDDTEWNLPAYLSDRI